MNKIKVIIAALFIFSFINVFPQVKFEKILGGTGYDYGYSVIQTFDKGYVVAGSTTSFGAGESDAYIIKTDSMGVPLWQRTFGGINIDQAYSVKQTRDSGLVIAGFTNSFGYGGYDMYVIKTDKSGDTLWTKTYGGSNWDFAYSIDTTNDGGYIISGGTYSFGKGDEDMYLVKINSIGDTIWTKTYGGLNQDEAKSVIQTSDGGYILTGFSKSFGDTLGDIYTVKTNPTGDTMWTKTIGGNGTDIGNSIHQTTDGGYITGAISENTAAGRNDAYMIKTTSTGDTIFTRKNGAPNDAADNDIIQTKDGGYIWVGQLKQLNYEVYLFKTDAGGNWNFAYSFGNTTLGSTQGHAVEQTTDGGYIVVANSTCYNNNLGDIYLFKTDSAGIASGIVINDATGITDYSFKNSNLRIFPNPTSGKFFIDFSYSDLISNSKTIKIYNSIGLLIFQNNVNINSNRNSDFQSEIDLSLFSDGIYFIKINTGYNVYSGKIILHR